MILWCKCLTLRCTFLAFFFCILQYNLIDKLPQCDVSELNFHNKLIYRQKIYLKNTIQSFFVTHEAT